jgi:hypothetical protein
MATSLPSHPKRWILVALLGLLACFAEAQGVRRQRRASSLRRDLAQARAELRRGTGDRLRTRQALEDFARVELGAVSGELGFQSSERVSLFARAEDELELVARYSTVPRFNRAERRRYPTDVGCLGRAWDDNHSELVVPVSRDQAREAWARSHADTGLRLDVVEALIMPTRTLVAFRVDDPLLPRKPLGVIVFESTSVASDTRVVEGGRGPVLEPNAIANQRSRFMPRIAGMLSIFCEVDGKADTLEAET